MPKWLGGLGIADLSKFKKALRLRWQWQAWQTEGKPWTGLDIPSSDTEIQLFRTCISIKVGNGNKVSFCADRWLDGQAPKDIAPELFKLAWRKRLTVKVACGGGRWMRGLHQIATAD
jgi:hypothetical protein